MTTRRRSGWQLGAALVVMLTTIIGPLLLAFVDQINGNPDSGMGLIVIGYLFIGVVLLVTFLPAVVMVGLYSLTVKSLAITTGVVVGLVVSAFAVAASEPGPAISLFVFPVAGVAAAVGAWAVNLHLDTRP